MKHKTQIAVSRILVDIEDLGIKNYVVLSLRPDGDISGVQTGRSGGSGDHGWTGASFIDDADLKKLKVRARQTLKELKKELKHLWNPEDR